MEALEHSVHQHECPITEICGGAGPVRLRLFAWFMARFGHKADHYLAPHKERLFADLTGTVLEIGPGAGANLRHFPGKGLFWIGVEPNPYMGQHLRQEAERLGIAIDLRSGTAENLPVETETVDAVVGTLVLCSVVDQRRAINEIVRVLKPGGRFVFIEHIAAARGTLLRRIQSAVRPAWRRMGDGCHPDRATDEVLQNYGFAKLEIKDFSAPLPIVRPHIAGVAIKA